MISSNNKTCVKMRKLNYNAPNLINVIKIIFYNYTYKLNYYS